MSACWIYCDIDGSGKRWRLAVERGGDDGPEVYFPAEDFSEQMSMAEYRETWPSHPVDPCRPPQRDPRIDMGVHRPEAGRERPSWRIVGHCSACYVEGTAWCEPDHQDDAWNTLRTGLQAQGWIVLQGDDRPAVSRERHAKSTRMFCPECAEELRMALKRRAVKRRK